MKKPYKIKIDDHEFFFLDEVLNKVKERYQESKEFDHNKKNLGGYCNGNNRKGSGRSEGNGNF